MNKRILIVEDEKNIVDILSFNLSKEGYETLEAYDGEAGLQLALEQNPDLILLDLMLPKMNGFDVCRSLRRENRSTPVIMLTAREEETDKVLGLELGADDYITKPFSMRELIARVGANIRRTAMAAPSSSAADAAMPVAGDLAINTDSHQVYRSGKAIDLTQREYELLTFLASHPNKVYSRVDLMEQVWNYGYVGDDVRVLVSEGCHLCKPKVSGLGQENDRMSEVKGVCEMSDVIIACMGLDSSLEGEEGDEGNEFASGDKPNLNLPGLQQEVLEAIYASGKPVVLVLLSGSALAVSWADEHIPAIIQGWYPGAQGGRALASVLFGDYSPEGKLPVTFYRTTEELPDFTDYSMKGRTYRYMTQKALYPFGYGLSYTDFELSNITLSQDTVDKDSEITVKAILKNTGKMAGAETVQVYVKADREGTPNAQLKALKKVELAAGEEKEVTLTLSAKSFGLHNENGDMVLGEGDYLVYVGTQQPDERSRELTGKQPECLKVTAAHSEVLVPVCLDSRA